MHLLDLRKGGGITIHQKKYNCRMIKLMGTECHIRKCKSYNCITTLEYYIQFLALYFTRNVKYPWEGLKLCSKTMYVEEHIKNGWRNQEKFVLEKRRLIAHSIPVFVYVKSPFNRGHLLCDSRGQSLRIGGWIWLNIRIYSVTMSAAQQLNTLALKAGSSLSPEMFKFRWSKFWKTIEE